MAMKPDTIQWLLDHAASAYAAEVESSDKIRERISFMLSIAIAPCFGVATYLLSSLRGETFAYWTIILFWVPLLISVVALLISTGFVAYALIKGPFKGFYYSRVPSPSQIILYFEAHPEPDSALEEGQLGLLKEYSGAVDFNFSQNEHRKSKLVWAQRFAFISFTFLILCVPKWAYNFTNNEQEVLPVKITSSALQEPQMPNQKTQQPATQPVTQTTPSTSSQTKSAFPKNTMALDSAVQVRLAFPKRTVLIRLSQTSTRCSDS